MYTKSKIKCQRHEFYINCKYFIGSFFSTMKDENLLCALSNQLFGIEKYYTQYIDNSFFQKKQYVTEHYTQLVQSIKNLNNITEKYNSKVISQELWMNLNFNIDGIYNHLLISSKHHSGGYQSSTWLIVCYVRLYAMETE